VLAKRAGLKLGDHLSLETDDGAHLFPVAAVANDYQAGGLTIYMDRAVAERYMSIGGVSGYAIAADRDALKDVKGELLGIVRRHGLLLQSLSDLQSEIDSMISSIEAGLLGLIALGLLIAAFGVVNTLLISVFEQSFEFGLLRIIAASRGQVRKVVFAQAFIIGAAALAPAVVAGVGISYLINLSTYGVTGHMIAFHLRPLLSLTAFVAGLALILVAAWIPAERASRVPLGRMLHLR
jgi:putative ABC transport system permease protein